ncbi:MAG: ATP-binding protein [bacterium]
MSKKKLFWQLYPSYLAITILALAAITVYSSSAFKKLFYEQTSSELEHTSRLVAQLVKGTNALERPKSADEICKQSSRNTSKRITVILPNGEVIGDSEEEPASMENHSDRPEVRAALEGAVGVATRHSHTLGRDMIYVAIPVIKDGRIEGVVRTAMPTKAMAGMLRSLYTGIALEDLFLAAIVAWMLLFISRRIVRPIEEIRAGARKFLEGDLSYRLRVKGSDEVKALASTMNQMAAELQERIDRLKQLENTRREFVANVSHELKTPVTSIRGFAETLRDGALDDPARAKRFLNIIASHAERISAIIEDLLYLSRIEQVQELEQVKLERGSILEVLESAISLCEGKATEKKIDLELSCDEGLFAMINAALFEQAVINLVDNAIKYSALRSSVRIEAALEGKELRIVVRDKGCGIPQEHLSRIFERFYRVDKGRSREHGGTGLGLAIVKHIVALHSGRVSVESAMGSGSAFTIRFPSA